MPDSNSGNLEQFGYKQELKRALGVRDLVIFGMVFMAPVSCMTLFGFMAAASGGHNFLCYLFAFIAMLFTAFSYSQMVQAFPVAGSVYTYSQRGIHPSVGFIGGWTILLDYFLIPMFLYVISAIFANALVPAIPFWLWVLIYVVPCMIVNILGVELAARVNFIMTALMVAAIFAFVIAAIRYAALGIEGTALLTPAAIYNPVTFNLGGVLQGTILAVLSYLGFDAISTLSEEATVPPKKIGLAMILACTIQTVLYMLVAYFGTVVAPDITIFPVIDSAFFDMCFKVGGYGLQLFVTLVIVISGFATALAGQSSASRVLYGMGRDRLIPKKFFAHLHPKYKTPIYNILMMGIVGLFGAILIDVNLLSNLVSFGGLIGFSLVNLSVIVYLFARNKSGKFFQHVLFPVIGMIVCLSVIFIGMIPLARIVGFSWMGIGIIYLIIRSTKPEFRELLKNITVSE